MERKTKILSAVSFLASLGLVVAANVGLDSDSGRAEAEGDNYTLSFTSASNLLTGSAGSQDVLTPLENTVSFTYSGYSAVSGAWGSLAASGYFANATAVSGLTELTVAYGATAGNLAVSYGWWDASTSSIDYEVTSGLITASSRTFSFDGYTPSFFKITASSAAEIASITIKYSCQATENPIPTSSNLTFTLSGSVYSVTACKSSATSIVIPSSYKGHPVTSIGNSAFNNHTSLTSITIPSSVTSIGTWALAQCSSLSSISLPSSITTIDYATFYGDSSLTSVTIPTSVTSIGSRAFIFCSKLSSITIPSSVTSIGDSAFSGCSSATSVSIPSSITSLGSSVFSECTSLTSVTIPTSVTSIGDSAFSGCKALTSVTIPTSVTSIGDYAFYNCTSLTSFTIPASVTSIGSKVLGQCSSLTSISLDSGNSSYLSVGGSLLSLDGTQLLAVPAGVPSLTIPSSVTSIETNMFSNCNKLSSITIPSSVTSIGSGAFQSCTSLTSMTIPSSVTSLGSMAFSWCTSLESVSLPNSITSIESQTFDHCSKLLTVNIPTSVTNIGSSAFSNDVSMTSIMIPSSVTTIGASAFYYCYKLSITCQAASKPDGWDASWNPGNQPVTWSI